MEEALKTPLSERVKKNPKERRDLFMYLFFLSWITFFHAELTRYPDGSIKPYEYTESNPFVQIIPNLLEKIKTILDIMKSYTFEGSF